MPKSNLRQIQKAETRRLLLDAACVLFEEKGYERTTMRELASSAGVALGTIFQHFPDKPSLLVAAFEDDIGRVVANVFETLPQEDLRAQFLHLTEMLYRFYATRPKLSRTLVKNAVFLDGQNAETLQSQVADLLDVLSQLIQAATERGEIECDLVPEEAAMAYWADYLLGLIGGLNAPEFDVQQQVALVGRLLDQRFNHFNRKTS